VSTKKIFRLVALLCMFPVLVFADGSKLTYVNQPLHKVFGLDQESFNYNEASDHNKIGGPKIGHWDLKNEDKHSYRVDLHMVHSSVLNSQRKDLLLALVYILFEKEMEIGMTFLVGDENTSEAISIDTLKIPHSCNSAGCAAISGHFSKNLFQTLEMQYADLDLDYLESIPRPRKYQDVRKDTKNFIKKGVTSPFYRLGLKEFKGRKNSK